MRKLIEGLGKVMADLVGAALTVLLMPIAALVGVFFVWFSEPIGYLIKRLKKTPPNEEPIGFDTPD